MASCDMKVMSLHCHPLVSVSIVRSATQRLGDIASSVSLSGMQVESGTRDSEELSWLARNP